MEEFKALGRILEQCDDDIPTMIRQLKRARQSWNGITRILKRGDTNAITMSSL